MLDEATRNWLNGLAIMKVTEGKEPDVEMSDEEKEYYEGAVDSMELTMACVGPENFKNIAFDVGYDL